MDQPFAVLDALTRDQFDDEHPAHLAGEPQNDRVRGP
jgi:hypothetical protein